MFAIVGFAIVARTSVRSSSRRQLSVKTDFGVPFQQSDASTRWWFSKMDYYWMPHLIHFASLADLVYSYTAVEVATVQCTDAVGSSALRCAIVCSVALLLYGCGARCRSVATTFATTVKAFRPPARDSRLFVCLFVCAFGSYTRALIRHVACPSLSCRQ